MTRIALILAIVATTANAQQRPEPDTSRAQNAGRAWSFARDGQVRRFEVRRGDRWAQDGAAPKERSESYFQQKLKVGRTYRIAFSMMVEPGPPNGAEWLLLAQVQSTFAPGESGHSPPIAVEMKGERMRFLSRTSPRPHPGQADLIATNHWTDKADLVRGRWYALEMIVRLDPRGDGLLKVSRDRTLLFDYRGALGVDEPVGAYLKQGIYRATAPERFAARFTEPTVTPLR